MGNSQIREPIQKRSIEKKEKIIECGFELICKEGYHNINTAEIAKVAGVSTGIIYQYFKDKHDILVEGIKKYSDSIFYPMLKITSSPFKKEDLKNVLRQMISKFVENHKLSKVAHEEITAMAHSDAQIAKIFYESEINMTDKISELLIQNGFANENIHEKVHTIIHLIDDLCHEIVYHKHEQLDYTTMIDITIDACCYILNN